MTLINELLSHFTTPQKTAEEIQAIPQDNKIYVEDWSEETGFFVVDIHHIWWPEEIECYRKEFFPWEFREYCEANYSFESYEEWWKGLLRGTQRIIVEDFVRVNEPMLRKELEEYYSRRMA